MEGQGRVTLRVAGRWEAGAKRFDFRLWTLLRRRRCRRPLGGQARSTSLDDQSAIWREFIPHQTRGVLQQSEPRRIPEVTLRLFRVKRPRRSGLQVICARTQCFSGRCRLDALVDAGRPATGGVSVAGVDRVEPA